jgi:hypothetical protein
LKKTFAIALLISVLFTSGCAQVLSGSQVSATLGLDTLKYSVVGDQAVIPADVKVQGGASGVYSAMLQILNPDDTWSNVASKEKLSGSKNFKFVTTLAKVGSFSYRLKIVNSNKKIILVTDQQSLSVADPKAGLRSLYYEIYQSCVHGESACLNEYLNVNYPGLISLTPREKSQALMTYSWRADEEPDYGSIIPDPTWLYPNRECEKNLVQLDISKPLPGRTFSVLSGGADPRSFHFTYLNGLFYIYRGFC